MNDAACARSAASSISSRVASRFRVGDVLGDGGAEQEAVVGDEGDLAAQRPHVDVAEIGPVNRDGAAGRVVETGQQRDEARLARTRRADERDDLAALDLEVDTVEGGLGRSVPEDDVPEHHVAGAGRKVLRVRCAGDLRVAIQHLEHAVAGGDRPLRHAERGPEHAHRPDQHDQVGVEGGEVTEGERAVDHLAPADEQHDSEPEVGQEGDHRVVERAQPGREHVLVEDAPDPLAEALEHVFLAGERLDDPHPGDRFLRFDGQLGDPLLDLLRGPWAGPPQQKVDPVWVQGLGSRPAPAGACRVRRGVRTAVGLQGGVARPRSCPLSQG